MIKIIMDSGKEYNTDQYDLKELIDECYIVQEMKPPIGESVKITKFNIKFLQITDKILINTNHISSIEKI